MTTCANCGRPVPCGCPNPVRADTALSSLFGVVCDRCDGYNDAGHPQCALCLQPLDALAPVAAAADGSPFGSRGTDLSRRRGGGGAAASEATLPALPPAELLAIAAAPARIAAVHPAPTRQAPLVAGPAAPAPALVELPPLPLASPKPPAVPLPLTAAQAGPINPRSPQALALTEVVGVEGSICGRCGVRNPAEFRFCTECGTALKAVETKARRPAAQPIAVGRAAARVLRGEKLGQTLGIGSQTTAGRAPGRLSFPSDPFLAQHHCSLEFQQSRFFVRDEGSPSGTFVRLREEEPLSPGDVFAIGDHLLRYVGPLDGEMWAPDGTRLLGCPRPPGTAVQIEEIHEGGVPGLNHLRLGPSLVIGRDEGCDLSFAGDPFVSGRHCNITIGASGRARIRDLGSTNGTFRRLETGSERELLKGDCIRIGSEVLQLVESAAPVL